MRRSAPKCLAFPTPALNLPMNDPCSRRHSTGKRQISADAPFMQGEQFDCAGFRRDLQISVRICPVEKFNAFASVVISVRSRAGPTDTGIEGEAALSIGRGARFYYRLAAISFRSRIFHARRRTKALNAAKHADSQRISKWPQKIRRHENFAFAAIPSKRQSFNTDLIDSAHMRYDGFRKLRLMRARTYRYGTTTAGFPGIGQGG